MALQFIQAAMNRSPIGAGTAIATANLPASATDGDILVMSVSLVPGNSVSAMPAGWQQFAIGSATWAQLNLYWKHASSEPATYSLGLTLSGGFNTGVYCLRGQNGSSSAIEASVPGASGTGATLTIPSITTTTANTIWFGIVAQFASDTLPAGFDLPAGWTEVGKVTSCEISTIVGMRVLTASGVAAGVNFSTSNVAGVSNYQSFSFAIIESAGAAPALAWNYSGNLMGVGR